jgi:hypothetical protein
MAKHAATQGAGTSSANLPMDGLAALLAWMQARELSHVCVVSPHLDDAAFSVASLLHALPSRSVLTVFSAARADSPDAYSRATGFQDPLAEFAARRQEDQQAMQLMGCAHAWVDAFTDRFDTAAVQHTVDTLAQWLKSQGLSWRQSLVLLPVGAGGVPTPWRRLFKRLRREPMGCRPHAEHEWVRDALRVSLPGYGASLAYYAEVPYIWGDRSEHIVERLQKAQPSSTWQVVRIKPDVSWKLGVARTYASQLAAEFGHSEAFQRKTIAAPERLYLPT